MDFSILQDNCQITILNKKGVIITSFVIENSNYSGEEVSPPKEDEPIQDVPVDNGKDLDQDTENVSPSDKENANDNEKDKQEVLPSTNKNDNKVKVIVPIILTIVLLGLGISGIIIFIKIKKGN